jgi:uncharacterized protein (DUF362 family)
MRRLLLLSLVAILSLLATPVLAAADMTCDHSGATIGSLRDCVTHAYDMKHIDEQGVEISLLAKVNAAQAAQNGGQTTTAINLLRSFVDEVNAQAGKHIVAEHAAHLVQHAQTVIKALGG